MNEISRSIKIEPRDQHFHFEATRVDWHGGSLVRSIIYNALSVMFPVGEKFFMDSVKHYRKDIDDPILLEQIKGFLVQEAMHTREHVRYNTQLDEQGFSATECHNWLKKVNDKYSPRASSFGRLVLTAAQEHITAMLADQLTSNPQYLDGADEQYRKVWLWHSIEEAEHKGVAFDTMFSVAKTNSYARRTITMLVGVILFNLLFFKFFSTMMKDKGLHRSPKAWGEAAWYLFGKPGFFRRMFLPTLAYFRPGFHPWSHDNRQKAADTEKAVLGDSTVYASVAAA